MANVLIMGGKSTARETLQRLPGRAGHLVASCNRPSAAPRTLATLAVDLICLDVGDG